LRIYREREDENWGNITYLAVFLREETDLFGDFRSDSLCDGFAVDYGGHLIGEGQIVRVWCGVLQSTTLTNATVEFVVFKWKNREKYYW
jgi:hypothetical protein